MFRSQGASDGLARGSLLSESSSWVSSRKVAMRRAAILGRCSHESSARFMLAAPVTTQSAQLSCAVMLLSVVLGCAESPQAARSPEPAHERQHAVHTEPKAEAKHRIPKRCARRKGECLPPRHWVERLC